MNLRWKFPFQPTEDRENPRLSTDFHSLFYHSFPQELENQHIKMQAPVIVMNDASARQTGRKAQTSNITAAKVLGPPSHFSLGVTYSRYDE